MTLVPGTPWSWRLFGWKVMGSPSRVLWRPGLAFLSVFRPGASRLASGLAKCAQARPWESQGAVTFYTCQPADTLIPWQCCSSLPWSLKLSRENLLETVPKWVVVASLPHRLPSALGAPGIQWGRGSGLAVVAFFPLELKPCV